MKLHAGALFTLISRVEDQRQARSERGLVTDDIDEALSNLQTAFNFLNYSMDDEGTDAEDTENWSIDDYQLDLPFEEEPEPEVEKPKPVYNVRPEEPRKEVVRLPRLEQESLKRRSTDRVKRIPPPMRGSF